MDGRREQNLKLRGYSLTVEPNDRVILRVTGGRLFEEFFGRIVGIILIVIGFVILEAKYQVTPWWGIGMLILVQLFLTVYIWQAVPILFEFRPGIILRHSRRWGYPLDDKLVTPKTLDIKREYETPIRGGFFRSVQLTAQIEKDDFTLPLFVAASRERLDEQVTDFLKLLEKEAKILTNLL